MYDTGVPHSKGNILNCEVLEIENWAIAQHMKFVDSHTLRKKERKFWKRIWGLGEGYVLTEEMCEQVKVSEIHGHPNSPYPRMYW